MDIPSLATVGGAAVLVIILEEVIKRAAALSDAAVSRFGPLLAVLIGIAVVIAANLAASGPLDIASAVLTGVMAGASASGLYSLGTSGTAALTARAAQPSLTDYDPKAPPQG